MKAKNLFKDDYTADSLVENTPKVKEDLVSYFEGLPIKLVKSILRDFEREELEIASIVTLKKT